MDIKSVFGRNRVLVAEFDGPDRLRVAKIQRGEPTKLLEYGEFDYSFFSQEELLRLLKAKFRTGEVIIIPSLNSATLGVKRYPLTREELAGAMPREVGIITNHDPNDLVYDYQIMGKTREGLLEVLIVTAFKSELLDQIGVFQEGGFWIRKIVTPAVALLAAIKSQSYRLAEGVLLMVNLGRKETNLLTAQQGNLLFSTQADLDLKDFPGNEMGYLPKITNEIKLVFKYLKREYRGVELSKVLLSGPGDLRQLTGPLNEIFGASFELFAPEGLELETDEGQVSPSQLAAIMGAVAGDETGLKINLAHGLAKRRPSLPTRKGWVIKAAALFLALFAVGFGYYNLTMSDIRQKTAEVTAEVERLRGVLQEATLAEQAAAEKQLRQAVFKSMPRQGPVVATTFKLLSLAVTPSMKFNSLRSVSKDQGFKITISGEVQAQNAAAANQEFSSFVQSLGRNPLIRQMRYLKPTETVGGRLTFELLLEVSE